MHKMIHAAVAVLILAGSPALAREAYEGYWNCDGMSMALEGNIWRPWGDTPPATIAEVMNSGRDWGFTLADGYRFSMMDVTETSATWTSLESGDTFECRRVGEAAQPASAAPAALALEPWVGMLAQGYVEGHATSPTGARIGSTCGNGKASVSFVWDGNQAPDKIEISVDGGPFRSFTPEYAATLTPSTPGYQDLVQAMIAGSHVAFKGADGQVASLSLSGSSRYLPACLNP